MKVARVTGVWLRWTLLWLWAFPLVARGNPELAARLQRSVVQIQVLTQDSKFVDAGSGVVVGTNEVVTNFHVVCNHQDLVCTPALQITTADGKFHPASIKYLDIERDLALLQADGPVGVPVQLRPFNTVRAGEKVFALGFPKGTRGHSALFTDGLVSGPVELSPEQPFLPDGQVFVALPKKIIQHTASIGRGSSGGGLFDLSGRLLGLNTYMTSPQQTQNLNAAVSCDHLDELPQTHQQTVAHIRSATRQPSAARGLDDLSAWIVVLEKEIQDHPENGKAWGLLAEGYFRSRRTPQAVQAARTAVQINPQDGNAWYWLGVATGVSGGTEAACYSFEQAIVAQPAHVNALIATASCRAGAGRLQEATKLLRVAVGLDPNNAFGWRMLAHAHLGMDDLENSALCLKQAHAAYQRTGGVPADLLLELGLLKVRLGDMSGARDAAFELDLLAPELAAQVRTAVADAQRERARLWQEAQPKPPREPSRMSKWQAWRDNKNTAHACATLGPLGFFFLGPVGLVLAPTVCCCANLGVWAYYNSSEPPIDEPVQRRRKRRPATK